MPLTNPIHVAIIMDGNGRWAKAHNKPRFFGHKKGVDALKNLIDDIVKSRLPISCLSVFAFSCENWSRSKPEVSFLMKLLNSNLNEKLIQNLNNLNVKFKWTGFEEKLNPKLTKKLKNVESKTKNNKGLIFNLVFNYSGTKEIEYVKKHKCLLTKNLVPIDLLIRTGNEKRISNFLLYQLAYAEIIFEKIYWPDYKVYILKKNIMEYMKRDRRFGNVK